MGVRCRHCSRLFDGTDELANHDCGGEGVTIMVIHPDAAQEAGENPARVFESRDDAEKVADEIDAPTRMIDGPLIPEGEV